MSEYRQMSFGDKFEFQPERKIVVESVTFDQALEAADTEKKVSGVPGVHWNKRAKKWEVQVQIGKVRKYGGCFADLDAAIRRKAELSIEMINEQDQKLIDAIASPPIVATYPAPASEVGAPFDEEIKGA